MSLLFLRSLLSLSYFCACRPSGKDIILKSGCRQSLSAAVLAINIGVTNISARSGSRGHLVSVPLTRFKLPTVSTSICLDFRRRHVLTILNTHFVGIMNRFLEKISNIAFEQIDGESSHVSHVFGLPFCILEFCPPTTA